MTACLMTLGNLLCGFAAIVLAVRGYSRTVYFQAVPPELVHAAWLLFLGMLLDALDGRVARWTRSASPFGAELDSLADMVSFGVAPAVLAWTVGERAGQSAGLLWAAGALYAACAAVRLARYNVLAASPGRKAKSSDFVGLPSPAAAGLVAGLLLLGGVDDLEPRLRERALSALPFVVVAAGLLMVARVPYLHLPNRLGRRLNPLTGVLAMALLAILALYPALSLATVFLGYALAGLGSWTLGVLIPRPDPDPDEELAEERLF